MILLYSLLKIYCFFSKDYEWRLRKKEAQYREEVANREKLEEEIAKLKHRLDRKLKKLEEKYRMRFLSTKGELLHCH